MRRETTPKNGPTTRQPPPSPPPPPPPPSLSPQRPLQQPPKHSPKARHGQHRILHILICIFSPSCDKLLREGEGEGGGGKEVADGRLVTISSNLFSPRTRTSQSPKSRTRESTPLHVRIHYLPQLRDSARPHPPRDLETIAMERKTDNAPAAATEGSAHYPRSVWWP